MNVETAIERAATIPGDGTFAGNIKEGDVVYHYEYEQTELRLAADCIAFVRRWTEDFDWKESYTAAIALAARIEAASNEGSK